MGSWPPERKPHHPAVAHAAVEPFRVWHTKTCGCPVRFITVRDPLGGSFAAGEVVQAVIVEADPHPDGTIEHLGDGFGETRPAGSMPGLYRRHPVAHDQQLQREAVASAFEVPVEVLSPDPTYPALEEAVMQEASLFDAPIPADVLFGGPVIPPPPPAPVGLHADPPGVEAHRAATEEAIERVERNSPEGWQVEAVAIIRDVASRFAQFTADDVWDAGLTVPPTPSALGPAFRAAQSAGYCTPTAMVQPSRYAQRHRALKVWESALVVAPQLQVSPLGWEVVPCKSCGAPVTWVRTARGADMPVNALGDPAGNLLVTDGDDRPTSQAASRDLPTWPGVLSLRVMRTTSHFATCPNAKYHRKARP